MTGPCEGEAGIWVSASQPSRQHNVEVEGLLSGTIQKRRRLVAELPLDHTPDWDNGDHLGRQRAGEPTRPSAPGRRR